MRIFSGSAGQIFHNISQKRWSGDEQVAGLTWGNMMTGDSLWLVYQKYRQFTSDDNILEIGPGYGRLLKTALQHKIPFHSYTGIELSMSRVERLNDEYADQNIHFVQGDVETWTGASEFTVVICSSTFEHLYPDCRKALLNLKRHLVPLASVFIDFIANTQNPILNKFVQRINRKLFYFERNGTYIRIYPKDELLALFHECGFTVRALETCTLGKGRRGPVNRLVVAAETG